MALYDVGSQCKSQPNACPLRQALAISICRGFVPAFPCNRGDHMWRHYVKPARFRCADFQGQLADGSCPLKRSSFNREHCCVNKMKGNHLKTLSCQHILSLPFQELDQWIEHLVVLLLLRGHCHVNNYNESCVSIIILAWLFNWCS